MKSTNASPSGFGWDFQRNAAIMLMLKNIKIAYAVKVEGETEDIEITLENGKTIYSQAKSVFYPYDDFSNVLANLKAGLKTLNNAATMPNVEQLIYVTNSPNPFSKKSTMGAFSGELTSLSYTQLPNDCRKQIDRLCEAKNYTFDRNLFSIYVMQFHGDGENRYKIIKGLVNEFLYSLSLGDQGLGARLLEIWQSDFFTNASHHDTKQSITKSQMVWPLIVLICSVNSEDIQRAGCDDGDVETILGRYGAIINNNSERFEFVTKVLASYETFGTALLSKERTEMFIAQKWNDYVSDFDIPTAEHNVLEKIVRLTISNVIKRRIKITEIKREVSL